MRGSDDKNRDWVTKHLFLILLNPDISHFGNSEDPDPLASNNRLRAKKGPAPPPPPPREFCRHILS